MVTTVAAGGTCRKLAAEVERVKQDFFHKQFHTANSNNELKGVITLEAHAPNAVDNTQHLEALKLFCRWPFNNTGCQFALPPFSLLKVQDSVTITQYLYYFKIE